MSNVRGCLLPLRELENSHSHIYSVEAGATQGKEENGKVNVDLNKLFIVSLAVACSLLSH